MAGLGGGCAAVDGSEMPMGVRVLPAGTTALGAVAGPGLEEEDEGTPVSELSCHRIQMRSSWHSPDSELSGKEARAIKMSDNTPVGISHMKVSKFTIFATADATSVPSILPLSLLIMYSETQSFGPLPNENFRVYLA